MTPKRLLFLVGALATVLFVTTLLRLQPVEAAMADVLTSFTLIDADTDQPIPAHDPLVDGAVINLETLPSTNLNIRANTSPMPVGSVVFDWNGTAGFKTETTPPYALFGDSGGDYDAWAATPGSYTLTGTPFSGAGGGGTAGTPLSIAFDIVQGVPSTADAGADQAIVWPDTQATLTGSATPGPGKSIVSTTWTQESGPSAATLGGANSTTLTASNLVAGTYIFKLAALDDTGFTATDTARVRVFDVDALTNIAPAGTATQPSTGWGGPPANAIDGNPNGTYQHTQLENQPWWNLDLGSVQDIHAIRIYNRSDCCSTRTNNLWVFVSDSPMNTSLTNLINDPNVFKTQFGTDWSVETFEVGETGRYVRLVLPGTQYLHVDEVQVFGAAPIADAGPDAYMELPNNSATFDGVGLALGSATITSYSWTQTVGPSTATLSGQNSASLTASDLVLGSYTFQLTVTDSNGATATDDVNVVVTEPVVGSVSVEGELTTWHPVEVKVVGPLANEADDAPNPFLDYRLQVLFTGPSGQTYDVPGFFNGDGNGNGTGRIWMVRFSPDEAGEWDYAISFRTGTDIGVSIIANEGSAVSPDGTTGSFNVAPRDPNAEGFLKYGRLEYVGEHYLKFRDGPYFLKGGSDSPENMFGYAGFDNTINQPGCLSPGPGMGPSAWAGNGTTPVADPIDYFDIFYSDELHRFPAHIADWNPGDPDWVSADTGYHGRAIIGFFNYLEEQHLNSQYIVVMNLTGDACDSYPYLAADSSLYNKTHIDISKVEQWNIVVDYAQRQGVQLQFVLAENSNGNNQRFLDNGSLGIERKFFYRELVARFGYIMGLKWNLGEESTYSSANHIAFADYITAIDPYGHPISVHHYEPQDTTVFGPLVGNPDFDMTSGHTSSGTNVEGTFVEKWRTNSANAGRKWVIDLDEIGPWTEGLMDDNANNLRKRIMYDVYFSGGNIEWYVGGLHHLPMGGDMSIEDMRTREEMWEYTWYARQFIEGYLPFWEMEPSDDLLTGEAPGFGGGEVFAKVGEVYAIFLPDGNPSGSLDLTGQAGTFEMRWFNPRTGEFEGSKTTLNAGSNVALGAPPSDINEDWVVLVARDISPTAIGTSSITAAMQQIPAPLVMLAGLLLLLSGMAVWRIRRIV